MTITSQPTITPRHVDRRRRALRLGTAALCGVTGVLYLLLFFLVRDAEAGLSENTFGAYLFLAIPYLAGAALMFAFDRRILWAVSAVAQVVVLTLFALFGAGLWGPGQGVFDYAALDGLNMPVWAAVVCGIEIALLAAFTYLTFARDRSERTFASNGSERES